MASLLEVNLDDDDIVVMLFTVHMNQDDHLENSQNKKQVRKLAFILMLGN